MNDFKDITPLIIDPAGHSKALLRTLLANLGVLEPVAVSRTDEALQSMRTEAYSIVFCDEMAGPLDPFDFLKALRRDLSTRDVTVPVVLVSVAADLTKIKYARDVGFNDVIAKPVSAGTIERKLQSLLKAPRPFVTAKAFVGPDRRGRSGDERRQFGERPAGEDRRGHGKASVFTVAPRVETEERT